MEREAVSTNHMDVFVSSLRRDGMATESVVLVNTLVLDLPIWRNCAISDFV